MEVLESSLKKDSNQTNLLCDLSIKLTDFTLEEKKIGKGPYGKVYLMKHSNTGENSIAKVIHEQIDINPEILFEKVTKMSTIHHPSIIKIIGYSPKDFRNMHQMELFEI